MIKKRAVQDVIGVDALMDAVNLYCKHLYGIKSIMTDTKSKAAYYADPMVGVCLSEPFAVFLVGYLLGKDPTAGSLTWLDAKDHGWEEG